MIASEHKHHVTVTQTRRDISGRNASVESTHVIGTEDEVAAYVAELVKSGLRHGNGPFTIAPIHPAYVRDLGSRP